MSANVHVFDYRLNDGHTKKYGYRFEIAKVSGKRKWVEKRGYDKKGDALREGNEALAKYNNSGTILKQTEMSFSDFLDYWIENDCKIDLKNTTVSGYEKRIRLYIKPSLGNYKLKTITKDVLQQLLKDLYNDGLAINTIICIKAILSKCFSYAADRKYIPFSPAYGLKIPRNQVPRNTTRSNPHVFIPRDKMQEIFNQFPEGTVAHIPLMLGYKCGLRLGEAYAIRWEDVDLKNKTINVCKQIQWKQDSNSSVTKKRKSNGTFDGGKGFWFLTKPKYNSVRTIEIDDALADLLKREKDRQERAKAYYGEYYIYYCVDENGVVHKGEAGEPINFVNVKESGEYVTPRTMQYVSRTIHTKLNYEQFDYHSLRHTHASMLLENGAPLKFIQERLGHKNIDITLNVYTHITEEMTRKGTEIINGIYR